MLIYGLTYDHTRNYGSNLQAYALQRVIEQTCISGEQCRYLLIPIRILKSKTKKTSQPKGFHMIYHRLKKTVYKWHFKQFQHFYEEYLHMADISFLEDLPALNETADAFICGSDVIWNPTFNYYMGAYYLDFAKKYKFSYAASFGKSSIDVRTIDQIKLYLPSFNEISCRESAGCEIIQKYTGRTAELVIDPVLLVSSAEWSRIAGKKKVSGKYIFVYLTHITTTAKSFIHSLAQKSGLKVVYATAGTKQAVQMRKIQIQTPETWLRQLRDAEYVVTNSFHATAFSVLFHKKFFTVVQGDKGKGINVRMSNFMQMIKLTDRLFSSVPDSFDFDEINYEYVDRKIEEMREESNKFLRRNLQAAYLQKKIETERRTRK